MCTSFRPACLPACCAAAAPPPPSPRAENWNGRIAMLGFTGILVTEFYSNMPTWQFWAERFGSGGMHY